MTTPTYSPIRLAVALLVAYVTILWARGVVDNVTPSRAEQARFEQVICQRKALPCVP